MRRGGGEIFIFIEGEDGISVNHLFVPYFLPKILANLYLRKTVIYEYFGDDLNLSLGIGI
jgi:hypothetical protein